MYCRMLIWEHSAILLTFIKLPFVIKIFVLSSFEWPLKTGFTVYARNLTKSSGAPSFHCSSPLHIYQHTTTIDLLSISMLVCRYIKRTKKRTKLVSEIITRINDVNISRNIRSYQNAIFHT